MGYCDFHLHTTHSDGTLTANALVHLCKERGLEAVAITDHDTTTGLEEGIATGEAVGVEVIPGIELSVKYDPGALHLLGYFIDPNSDCLKKGLAQIQEARRRRNPEVISRLRTLGVEISEEEVKRESGGGQIGRPHFARVLVKKGYVKDFEEAFAKYLRKGAAAYVDKRKLSPQEGVQMIEEAGGIAVLAHPVQLRTSSREELEQVLKGLVGFGLRGIEAYSSCQTREEAALYRELGERYDLFVTGGSDFHGENKPGILPGQMGEGASVSYELVERMKAYLNGRKKLGH